MNLLMAGLELLGILIALTLIAVLCVIMVPLLIVHIVYTNWKEYLV